MTARVLSPSEWACLAETEIAPVLERIGHADPNASVVVVEHDGRIVGYWIRVTMQHVEGLYIDPAYRGKSSVARRLWAAMRQDVQAHGAEAVITGARTDDIRHLLQTAGAEQLPDQYVMPMGD